MQHCCKIVFTFVQTLNIPVMKISYFLSFAALLALPLLLTSCDKDDPIIPNEEELITTVIYTLNPGDVDNSSVTLSFVDLDGDGDMAPTIIGGTLTANTVYSGSLELLNEAGSPVEDITEEVQAEGDEHQFFFQSTVDGLIISYSDQDGDGNPVGLKTIITTGAAASGNLTIILRHEPVKDAAGVSAGDITNAQGETDIQVTFPIDVQ